MKIKLKKALSLLFTLCMVMSMMTEFGTIAGAVNSSEYVAKVYDYITQLNTYHDNFDEAITSAQDGDTIILLENISQSYGYSISEKEITIDLNGFDITSTEGTTFSVFNEGKLTINGSGRVIGGTGGDHNAVCAYTGGQVIINGGTYTVGPDKDGFGNSTIYCTTNAEIVINGGYFRTDTTYNGKYYVLNLNNNESGVIKVYGGQFEKQNPAGGDLDIGNDFLADGYKVTVENDVYTVVVKNYFADVNGVKFETLAEAIAVVDKSETVILLADTYEDVVIPEGKDITLDLSTFTLTNVSDHTIINNGLLTIIGNGTIDSVIPKKGAIYNNGVIEEISGGTFTRSQENSTTNSWYVAYNAGTIRKISGGTFINTSTKSSVFANNGTTDKTAIIEEISGGIFKNAYITLKNNSYCEVEKIIGGTFITTGFLENIQNSGYIGEISGTAAITGGKYAIDNVSYKDNEDSPEFVGTVTIKDGATITAAEGGYAIENNNQPKYETEDSLPSVIIEGGSLTGDIITVGDTSLIITGGYFSADPSEYLAEGYGAKKQDGYYKVSHKIFVATVNGIPCESLEEALDMAEPGNFVQLIANIDIDKKIIIDKDIILNLNGFNITSSASAFEIFADVTIIGDGEVSAGSGGKYNALYVGEFGNLIVNSGTYCVGTNESGASNITVLVSGGNLIINGGHFSTAVDMNASQVIDQDDHNPGSIKIYGGTFAYQNPANGDNTLGGNFIADGFEADADGNTYTVTKVYIAPSFIVIDDSVFLIDQDRHAVSIGIAYTGSTKMNAADITWDSFVTAGCKYSSINGNTGYVLYSDLTDENMFILDMQGYYVANVKYVDKGGKTKSVYYSFQYSRFDTKSPTLIHKAGEEKFEFNTNEYYINILGIAYIGISDIPDMDWNRFVTTGKKYENINGSSGYLQNYLAESGEYKLTEQGYYAILVKYTDADGNVKAFYETMRSGEEILPPVLTQDGNKISLTKNGSQVLSVGTAYTGEVQLDPANITWERFIAAGRKYKKINTDKGYQLFTDFDNEFTFGLNKAGYFTLYVKYISDTGASKTDYYTFKALPEGDAPEIIHTNDSNKLNFKDNNYYINVLGIAYIGKTNISNMDWNKFISAGKRFADINSSEGYIKYLYADSGEYQLNMTGYYAVLIKYTDESGNVIAKYSTYLVDNRPLITVDDGEVLLNANGNVVTSLGIAYTGDTELNATTVTWEQFVAEGKKFTSVNSNIGYRRYVNPQESICNLGVKGYYTAYMKYTDPSGREGVIYSLLYIDSERPPVIIHTSGENELSFVTGGHYINMLGIAYIGESDIPNMNWNSFVAAGKKHQSINGLAGYVQQYNAQSGTYQLNKQGYYAVLVKYTNPDGITKVYYQTMSVK